MVAGHATFLIILRIAAMHQYTYSCLNYCLSSTRTRISQPNLFIASEESKELVLVLHLLSLNAGS
jgi:hypothetical protein